MQKPKRRSYIIDLNGPAARGNLKLLGLLYPGWGLALPLYIIMIGRDDVTYNHMFGALDHPLLIGLYLTLLLTTVAILSNRMVITGKSMRFGHHPLVQYKIDKLKDIVLQGAALADKDTLLQFQFENTANTETIDAQGMENRMKSRLMAAIDNFAPQYQMPKHVRTFLGHAAKNEGIQRLGDKVTVPYHSRLFLIQMKERIELYQQYFWRVWAAFFGTLTLFLFPLYAILVAQQMWKGFERTTALGSLLEKFAFTWSSMWSWLTPVAQEAIKTTSSVANASQNISVAVSLITAAIVFGVTAFIYMSRPNRLTIQTSGLKLHLEYLGATWTEQLVPWEEISVIVLRKGGNSNPDNWKLILRDTSGKTVLSLTLGALRSNAQKLELVKAIEKYAPEAHIDADVLSALAPPTESSYTELWISSLASAPQREKLTPLSAGHTLKRGEYSIDARHGSGGQGVTYLAHKISEKQPQSSHHIEAAGGEDDVNLVIKETILPIYVDSQHRKESVEHFEKDARLLLRLEHPHLVQLRDYFIEDHRAYLVLDRVRGQNLRQVVESRGRLQPSEVLGLARQMCEILTYLHAQQPEIIHRDFTPENLMLDQLGQLKLIDFGVAHELKSRTTATVVGKHAYLPPEQFRGKPCSQSDLYALGATLYFILTGSDPEPLSRLNPLNQSENDLAIMDELSEDEKNTFALLCRAIEHATELNISQRTASAADVLAELKDGAVIVIKSRGKGEEWEKLSQHKSDGKLLQTPQPELTNG